jgi:predicted KAP-like P-loop ATPase
LTERFRPFRFGLCVVLVICSFSGFARAQEISPTQEQEFIDAQAAVEAAQKAQAEKYALENLKQAQDLLGTADKARKVQDSIKFTQSSSLARAYAELAQALAELKSVEERLAAAREELQKTRAEIDRLKKSQ